MDDQLRLHVALKCVLAATPEGDRALHIAVILHGERATVSNGRLVRSVFVAVAQLPPARDSYSAARALCGVLRIVFACTGANMSAEPNQSNESKAVGAEAPREYAIVELMGHRRYGAEVREVERFGGKFLQATVLTATPFQQLVSPSAIYSLTPCTEEQARRVNDWSAYRPRELGPGEPESVSRAVDDVWYSEPETTSGAVDDGGNNDCESEEESNVSFSNRITF